MFRPYIQRTYVLVVLAVLNLLIVYFSLNYKNNSYKAKVQAAINMNLYLEKFAQRDSLVLGNLSRLSLVGSKSSPIRTNPGSRLSKVSTLNPQFASLIVEMLMDMGVAKGDTVAASITGSYPGANLAFIAAVEAMHVHPQIISSFGSSSFGATDINFNWLDMQDFLFEEDQLSFFNIGIALGGENDLGSSFSNGTIEFLLDEGKKYSEKYDVAFLYNSENNLENQINSRYNLFKEFKPVDGYSAFINIGGGSASVGVEPNLEPGINKDYGGKVDCLSYRFSRDNVLVAKINDIERLVSMYGLTYGDLNVPSKLADTELMIYNNQYDLLILFIGLLLCLGTLIYIGRESYAQIKKNSMKEENLDAFL